MTKKTEELNYFQKLNSINVADKIEKKNGLSYLSWAWAWQEVKKRYPDIKYEVVKNENGLPFFKSDEGYIVYTRVTINNTTHEMWLPVMDGANKAMKSEPYTYKVQKKEWSTKYNKYIRSKDSKGNYLFEEKQVEAATMFDINTAIMRCLVKNVAMHGLGLYIYAGEDIPSSEKDDILETEEKEVAKKLDKIVTEDFDEELKKMNQNTANVVIDALDQAISAQNLEEIADEYRSDVKKLQKYDKELLQKVLDKKAEMLKKLS